MYTRYAFTVMSSLFVYIVTYFSLSSANTFTANKVSSDRSSAIITPPNIDNVSSNLSQADSPKFTYLSLIVSIVGLLFQVVFHLGTNEHKRRRTRVASSFSAEERAPIPESIDFRHEWMTYLKSTRFYTVGILYMSTRLIINMFQVYVPMYLTNSINLNKVSGMLLWKILISHQVVCLD